MKTFSARVIIDIETDYSKDTIESVLRYGDVEVEYVESNDSSLPILYIRKKDA